MSSNTIIVRITDLRPAQRNPETDLVLTGRGKIVILSDAAQAVVDKPRHWDVVIEITREGEKVRFGRIVEIRQRRTAAEQEAHDKAPVRLGDLFPVVPSPDVEAMERMVVAAYMVADLPYPPNPMEGLAVLRQLGGVAAELADVVTTGRYADLLPRAADAEQWRVEQEVQRCAKSIYHLDRMSGLYADTPAATWAGNIIAGLRQKIVATTVLRNEVLQRLEEGWVPGQHTVRYGWVDYETIGGHYTDNISDAGVSRTTAVCLVHPDQVGRQPFRDEKEHVLTLSDAEWALMESQADQYLTPTAFLKEWMEAKEARYLERVKEDASVRPYSAPEGNFRWAEILRRSAEGWVVLGVHKETRRVSDEYSGFGAPHHALVDPDKIRLTRQSYAGKDHWGRLCSGTEKFWVVKEDGCIFLTQEEHERLPENQMRMRLEAAAETAYRELCKARKEAGYHGEFKDEVWDRFLPTGLKTDKLIAWTHETQRLAQEVWRWRREFESVNGDGDPVFVEVETIRGGSRYPHQDVRLTTPDGRAWVVAHEAEGGTEVFGVFRLVGKKSAGSGRSASITLRFSVVEEVVGEVVRYDRDETAYQWALGRGGDGIEPTSSKGSVAHTRQQAVERTKDANRVLAVTGEKGVSSLAAALRKAGVK